jgi:hypothetical protein
MNKDGNKHYAALGVTVLVILVFGCAAIWKMNENAAKNAAQIETAKNLCTKWAANLDSQTTDAGVYKRPDNDEPKHILPEIDPWGNSLVALYSRGGGMETVEVRSWGPDGEEYTSDDLTVERRAANLAGVGAGIRGGARGALNALKAHLPGRKTKSDDEQP